MASMVLFPEEAIWATKLNANCTGLKYSQQMTVQPLRLFLGCREVVLLFRVGHFNCKFACESVRGKEQGRKLSDPVQYLQSRC